MKQRLRQGKSHLKIAQLWGGRVWICCIGSKAVQPMLSTTKQFIIAFDFHRESSVLDLKFNSEKLRVQRIPFYYVMDWDKVGSGKILLTVREL